MKKKNWLYLVMLVALGAGAMLTNESIAPVYFPQTGNAFTVYIVGGSTTSAAAYDITPGSSITFRTTLGLLPGATGFDLTSPSYDTLDELINAVNALPVTTPGAEGGIRMAIVQGAYGGNWTTELVKESSRNCLGAAAVKTSSFTRTIGLSYVLPKSRLREYQQFHITDFLLNVTFTAGSCLFEVYDGSATTSTMIRRESIGVSASDGRAEFTENGYFENSPATDLRFDIRGSSWISAGWINFTGYKR